MTERFERRVAEVDRLVRELAPDSAAEVRRTTGPGDSAQWDRAGSWATLTLHDDGRLELTLHTGSDVHPDALEIGLDDPDVAAMIAQPVATLLAGASGEP